MYVLPYLLNTPVPMLALANRADVTEDAVRSEASVPILVQTYMYIHVEERAYQRSLVEYRMQKSMQSAAVRLWHMPPSRHVIILLVSLQRVQKAAAKDLCPTISGGLETQF